MPGPNDPTYQQLQERLRVLEASDLAKSELISLAGHELRTPLTPILLLVSLLEQTPELPAELKEDLAAIRQNVEAEAFLIDELLDMGRILRGTMKVSPVPTDVHAAITAAIEKRDQTEPRSIQTDLAAEPSMVLADPTRLLQMIGHLLSNAIKFTPPAGSIAIRTRNEAGRVCIDVIDSGKGIDAEQLIAILQPFGAGKSTRPRGSSGLGLGLAIVNGMAAQMNATLSAVSDGPGKGATFSLTFPALSKE